LWSRILQDPKCKEFLKKHKDEFAKESFVPQPIAFPELGIPSSFMADVIKEAMPFDNPEHQMLAEMYLAMSARRIASKLDWPRRKVYVRLRNLKRIALRRWKSKRRKMVGAREETRDLDTSPDLIALKVKTFTFLGRSKNAYLIQVDEDDDLKWVDENGQAFTQEIQVILNNIEEYGQEFEHVDIDNS
jgi:hypothetical protein